LLVSRDDIRARMSVAVPVSDLENAVLRLDRLQE